LNEKLDKVSDKAKPGRWIDLWHKPVFIAFLFVSLPQLVSLAWRIEWSAGWRWVEGLWLVLGVLTSLLALGKRLPLQNVAMAAVLISLISGGILAVGTLSGVPFGPFLYSDLLGEKLLEILPWSVPLIWMVVIINARGVARLIMRPWRKTNYYGYWVIGFTCLLAVWFDLGLEPFAVFVKEYWIWRIARPALHWYTAPWVNSLGWFVTVLAVLAFTTPWLINKQPVKQPIDYHPLIVWLLLNACLMAGNAAHHLWLAVAVTLGGNLVATVFAIRGARW
jgi:putative membrane protein